MKRTIDLHYGPSPVQGDSDIMCKALAYEREFCALYTDELPAEVHNNTTDFLINKYGAHAVERGLSYIRPFLVDRNGIASVGPTLETKLVENENGTFIVKRQAANAQTLRGTGFKVGGIFFNEDLAESVLKEFKLLGYEINNKYD